MNRPRFPNPLSDVDMADPSVLRVGDLLYVYSTGWAGRGGAYPIRTSPVGRRTSWTLTGAILKRGGFPPWYGGHGSFWAPEVHRVQDRYVCYFCTRDADQRFNIGAAVSSTPDGPFKPLPEPLVSNPDVGLIDATYFQDPISSRSFVLWKEDANDFDPPRPTGIFIQELEPDGLRVKGEWKRLLVNDQPWEGVLIEAPTLIHRNGWYYLFFSGNVYSDEGYGVGVARARDVLGPYEKYAGNPILRSNGRFDGPGHQFLFEEGPDQWTIFYHARDRRRTEQRYSRLLMSDPVTWREDGWPSINDGTPSEGWNGWEAREDGKPDSAADAGRKRP